MSSGAWVPPAVLQVIAWDLSMAVALPTSLLVDMPERQQVDVALQVSDACVDVEMKNAVPRLASLEDWRSDEARATMQAIVIAMVNRRRQYREHRRGRESMDYRRNVQRRVGHESMDIDDGAARDSSL